MYWEILFRIISAIVQVGLSEISYLNSDTAQIDK